GRCGVPLQRPSRGSVPGPRADRAPRRGWLPRRARPRDHRGRRRPVPVDPPRAGERAPARRAPIFGGPRPVRTTRGDAPMTDDGRRSLLTSVWLVLGAAVGAAIGNGSGGHTAGLVLGAALGAGAGYGVGYALARRG